MIWRSCTGGRGGDAARAAWVEADRLGGLVQQSSAQLSQHDMPVHRSGLCTPISCRGAGTAADSPISQCCNTQCNNALPGSSRAIL